MKLPLPTLLLASVFLVSCASVSRQAPRFTAPSTKPIARATQRATAHITSAQGKARQLEGQVPETMRLQIVSLEADLDNAFKELTLVEGARKQLLTQLLQQSDQANKLANDYDKSSAEITSLKVSRHRYVQYLMGASLLLVLALAWIFKRPLLLLCGL